MSDVRVYSRGPTALVETAANALLGLGLPPVWFGRERFVFMGHDLAKGPMSDDTHEDRDGTQALDGNAIRGALAAAVWCRHDGKAREGARTAAQ